MKSSVFFTVLLFISAPIASAQTGFLPGERTVIEAHNSYPHHGLWRNRIDNALDTGFPVAIELDLMWHEDATTGEGRLIVAHNPPFSGNEPTLESYFFDRVRPLIEAALENGDPTDWPLITLNINDIRSNRAEPFAEVWRLVQAHAHWWCSAVKGAASDPPAPLHVGPVLALSNSSRLATEHFYDAVPVGGKLLVFGSGRADAQADNFRRWINYGWSAVEPEGQHRATTWTTEDEERLHALVRNAHERGYWIRFFSLNGHGLTAGMRLGLNPFYNFGSLEAVQLRWKAASDAGVDFIATDQITEAKIFLNSEL